MWSWWVCRQELRKSNLEKFLWSCLCIRYLTISASAYKISFLPVNFFAHGHSVRGDGWAIVWHLVVVGACAEEKAWISRQRRFLQKFLRARAVGRMLCEAPNFKAASNHRFGLPDDLQALYTLALSLLTRSWLNFFLVIPRTIWIRIRFGIIPQ